MKWRCPTPSRGFARGPRCTTLKPRTSTRAVSEPDTREPATGLTNETRAPGAPKDRTMGAACKRTGPVRTVLPVPPHPPTTVPAATVTVKSTGTRLAFTFHNNGVFASRAALSIHDLTRIIVLYEADAQLLLSGGERSCQCPLPAPMDGRFRLRLFDASTSFTARSPVGAWSRLRISSHGHPLPESLVSPAGSMQSVRKGCLVVPSSPRRRGLSRCQVRTGGRGNNAGPEPFLLCTRIGRPHGQRVSLNQL
jgi:hypothetical protein